MESVDIKSLIYLNGFTQETIEKSLEALILVDSENHLIIDCNDSAILLFESLDKKDLINNEISTTNKILNKKNSLFKFLNKMDSIYKEVEFISKKGKYFWGEVLIKNVYHENKKFYLLQVSDITEKRRVEEELSKNSQFIKRIAEASPNSIYVYSLKESRVIYSNNKLAKQLGYSYREVKEMGKNYPICLMHEDDSKVYIRNMDKYKYIYDDEIYENEYRMKDSKDKWHWISFRSTVFSREDDGTIKEIIGIAQDITLRKQFEYDNLRLAAFPRANPNPVLECDFEGNITYINPATHKLMLKMNMGIEHLLPKNHINICIECSKNNETNYEHEIEFKDKTMLWSYNPVSNIGYIHIYGFDITEQKISENRLIHDALHDDLTNLPNRALFLDRLNNAFLHLKRKKDYYFAVLFLDLDRFKIVNDSLGHFAGDKLLIELSKRLHEIIRPTDTLARLGGDEFTILIDEIKSIGDVITVADRIRKALSYPFNVEEHDIFTTVSIGIALSSTNGNNTPEEMMRNADAAMYSAKSKGKDRFEIFDSIMHTQAVDSLRMETELWKALEKNEFYLEYQPILSFKDYKIDSFEALIRWKSIRKGNIYPVDFIDIAENAGIISHLDIWVLENSCKQINEWEKNNIINENFSLSINLSSKNFLDTDFANKVKHIIDKYNINPSYLKFEITEKIMSQNIDNLKRILYKLRAMNIKLQIDDFGTGYSSLSFLHKLPIDALKIDSSFIKSIDTENESYEIVKTIITLASSLGISVIAEGIETEQQLNILNNLNCHFGQGYLFYKPLSAQGIVKLLNNTHLIENDVL
ncbi:MAG: EAL domain-containing protein [Candidatus Sericytochromatia bacterium]